MPWPWIGFFCFILIMLALDLGVFHKNPHRMTAKESTYWSLAWFLLAMCFNVVIFVSDGHVPALEFFTGYLIEKSLSLDNIFVIYLIFKALSIPPAFQHRVLFWGIVAAIFLRGVMIAMGISLINNFEWIIYVFGGFLVYSAYQTFVHQTTQEDVTNNPILLKIEEYFPLAKGVTCKSFFLKIGGKWHITPLFVALVFVEFSDLMFAVDSVPAILAITRDTYIVFTSNIFAIFGLRSLYFLLAHVVETMPYIRHGLSAILGFVGVKMLISEFVHIPIWLSLLIIIGILLFTFLTPKFKNHRD